MYFLSGEPMHYLSGVDTVADKLKKLNIHLQKGRRSGRRLDNNSYQAGKVAGDRASFGRPVSGDGGVLRLTND